MSRLHILLPPLATLANDHAFLQWLARGNHLSTVADARSATLRMAFRFAGDSVPFAALRHHAVAGDAGSGAWLAADPAYVRSEATGARLMACPVADITRDEALQLAATLKPLFGDAGVPLDVDTPSTWCLHLPGGMPVDVAFVPPAEALGVDLLECLPQGGARRTWRRLFNEAQVALNAHPVNVARVAAGKQPVNALWFWGAGVLPSVVETTVRMVASGDPTVQGLAKLAGVACVDPSVAMFDPCHDGEGDALLDLDPLGADVISSRLPGFRRWLRDGRFKSMGLVFADGHRFQVRHHHRLRFWRRA